MRRVLLPLAGVLVAVGCDGCAARRAGPMEPRSTTQPVAAALDPAPTPGEAYVRMLRAMADGDEAAFRGIVVFRDPADYAEAQSRSQFAAARLYRAVRERGVTGRRDRTAGFDRNERLIVNEPPSPASLGGAIERYRQAEWRVDGNVATPTTGPTGPGKPRVERVGGGWVVVLNDEWADGGADTFRTMSQIAIGTAMVAAAVDAAATRVEAGELRTIRDVNEFIEAHRKAATTRAVAELKARPPTGPVVVVTDVETGEPVAGARVSAQFVFPAPRGALDVHTDAQGRARLAIEPNGIHDIRVRADGYAARHADVSSTKGTDGRPDEVRIEIGRPVVVEVTLVLPDERRAAASIYEGEDADPAPRGLRERIEPKRLTIPVEWEDPPPDLPRHNPMLRLVIPMASPHGEVEGVTHRVTAARTAAGREMPVFRDGPPPDEQTFGMYELGRNGMGDTVFVIGTFADARAADATVEKFQWTRNVKLLGPATKPATAPTTRQ